MNWGVNNNAMLGQIAVHTLYVHGRDRLQIRQDAVRNINAQIHKGLEYLRDLEPRANLHFSYSTAEVTLNERGSPGKRDPLTDAAEIQWLEPAVQSLGAENYEQYLSDIASEARVNQAVLVVVSSLPKPTSAYSTECKITLDPGGAGYSPSLLHVLFVHEMCHVFGAADERPDCHCDTPHGLLQTSHDNCYVCNPNPEPCVMAANSLRLCASTRHQIGWDSALFEKRT